MRIIEPCPKINKISLNPISLNLFTAWISILLFLEISFLFSSVSVSNFSILSSVSQLDTTSLITILFSFFFSSSFISLLSLFSSFSSFSSFFSFSSFSSFFSFNSFSSFPFSSSFSSLSFILSLSLLLIYINFF